MEDKEELPIHPAVDLLLRRMESNPEEFVTDAPWAVHYQQYKAHWNAREKHLFSIKMREIRMQAMHEKLMNHLCNREDKRNTGLTFTTHGDEVLRIGASGSIGVGSVTPTNSLRIGNTTIDEALINAIKEHLDD
jgi:hypothetical protein